MKKIKNVSYDTNFSLHITMYLFFFDFSKMLERRPWQNPLERNIKCLRMISKGNVISNPFRGSYSGVFMQKGQQTVPPKNTTQCVYFWYKPSWQQFYWASPLYLIIFTAASSKVKWFLKVFECAQNPRVERLAASHWLPLQSKQSLCMYLCERSKANESRFELSWWAYQKKILDGIM